MDDLAITAKKKEIWDTLQEKFKLKLRATGPLSYHLGWSYVRDPDGSLVGDPSRHVARILFGSKPRNARRPLEGGDQLELDTAELRNDKQSKIGQLMWAVTLGRFDISAPVMLRQAPLCIYHMPLEDETLELEGCMICIPPIWINDYP